MIELLKITQHTQLAPKTYQMVLHTEKKLNLKAGQFVNIQISGQYLRRPISVCDSDQHHLTIVYKVVGKGTEKLSQLQVGEELNILLNLGNGYKINTGKVLLIGGGVGIPPLYKLAKELLKVNIPTQVILGFNNAKEVFYKQEFEELQVKTIITTVDGSLGQKGLVTDALANIDYDYIYCCGPEPMLKAIYHSTNCDGQYSFEERMGCGFGACMGCSCITNYGYKRICKEGPVLQREEIKWKD